jgi:preprotein translocase subunit SecE
MQTIMISPVTYFRQVKAEMKKVSWPTRQETTVSAIAVFVMVVLSSIFLFAADQLIALAVRFVIGLGA